MSRIVVLDSAPLGLLTAPPRKPSVQRCCAWLASHMAAGTRIILPEIIDYELRRELLRIGSTRGIGLLDSLAATLEYLPLATPAMRLAAELWAKARQQGLLTAGDSELDVDVILAAQALCLRSPYVIVATTNVGHLARFVAADDWERILP